MLIKRFFVIVFTISYLALFLCGCNNNKSDSHKKKTTEPGVADYMVGDEQLKTYQKTKSKMEDINKTLKNKYKEIE